MTIVTSLQLRPNVWLDVLYRPRQNGKNTEMATTWASSNTGANAYDNEWNHVYYMFYPHQEDKKTMATVNITKQTETNRRLAEEVAKNAAQVAKSGFKATVRIESVTMVDPGYAVLTLTNRGSNDEKSSQISVACNEADLEQLQRAVYDARVALRDAHDRRVKAQTFVNPKLPPAWIAF